MSKYLLKLYSKIYRSYKSLAKRITFCTHNIKIENLSFFPFTLIFTSFKRKKRLNTTTKQLIVELVTLIKKTDWWCLSKCAIKELFDGWKIIGNMIIAKRILFSFTRHVTLFTCVMDTVILNAHGAHGGLENGHMISGESLN